MLPPDFRTLFQTATGNQPYDWQCRLTCGEQDDRPESEWLSSGTTCESRLINIPTGLGKTVAAIRASIVAKSASEGENHG